MGIVLREDGVGSSFDGFGLSRLAFKPAITMGHDIVWYGRSGGAVDVVLREIDKVPSGVKCTSLVSISPIVCDPPEVYVGTIH